MKTIIAMLVSLCFATSAAKGAFVLHFFGPGGTLYSITDTNYFTFTTTGWKSSGQTANKTTTAWGAINMFGGQPDSLNIAFAAPDGQDLGIGLRQNVVSYGLSNFTKNRMDISGGGIPLDTTMTGSFNVLEIGFDATGKVNKAAIDFDMSGRQGTLRFNSTLPLAPIPESSTLMIFTLVGGLAVTRRRK